MPAGIRPGPVSVGIRPHDWQVVPTAGLSGTVASVEHHGDFAFAEVDLGSDRVTMRFEDAPSIGDAVEVWTRRFHLFDQMGRAIAHVE